VANLFCNVHSQYGDNLLWILFLSALHPSWLKCPFSRGILEFTNIGGLFYYYLISLWSSCAVARYVLEGNPGCKAYKLGE